MLDERIREGWDRLMRPVGRALAQGRIDPNAITLIGLGIQVLVALKILEGELAMAGLLAIAAALADTLDGAVAKARGLTTKFGALLDSSVDRLSDALFFIPVAWLYGVSPRGPETDHPWVAALALTALVASYLVSYVKARAQGLGYDCRVGLVERAERAILMIVGLLFSALLPLILAVLTAFSIVTFVQRLLHVRSQMKSAA